MANLPNIFEIDIEEKKEFGDFKMASTGNVFELELDGKRDSDDEIIDYDQVRFIPHHITILFSNPY